MASVATRARARDGDMDSEPIRQRRFTREEYFRMAETGVLGPEDRTELINGYLVEMAAQNAPHRATVGKVDSQFQQILEERDYWIQTQATLPLDCRNVPEPDIAILSGAPDDLLDGEPDEIPLIVEVANTTLTYDRTEKLVCYASNDIPEYWIANLQSHTLECYHDPADDEYRDSTTHWGWPLPIFFLSRRVAENRRSRVDDMSGFTPGRPNSPKLPHAITQTAGRTRS